MVTPANNHCRTTQTFKTTRTKLTIWNPKRESLLRKFLPKIRYQTMTSQFIIYQLRLKVCFRIRFNLQLNKCRSHSLYSLHNIKHYWTQQTETEAFHQVYNQNPLARIWIIQPIKDHHLDKVIQATQVLQPTILPLITSQIMTLKKALVSRSIILQHTNKDRDQYLRDPKLLHNKLLTKLQQVHLLI